MKKKKERLLPAIPPDDYKGTMADWLVELRVRGFWDEKGWFGDVEIPEREYIDILKECEKGEK